MARRRTGWPAVALAALRVGSGAVFVAFSLGKFARHGAEADAFERYGIPFPDAATYLVGGLELVGGLLLVLGLFTRPAALALAADMVGAISTAGRIEGGAVHLGLAPALLASMIVLAWAGPGRWALQERLGGGPGARATGGLAAALLALAVLAPAGVAGPPAASLSAGDSAYGRILFDGTGRALYAFTRDRRGHSACAGACARAWPPYLVGGRPRAGAGVRGALIGTVRRPGGARQVTYAGRPLYYYVGDDAPGVVKCQNVYEYGGLWLVQRPRGALVR